MVNGHDCPKGIKLSELAMARILLAEKLLSVRGSRPLGDGLASLGHSRLLTADLGQSFGCVLEMLLVGNRRPNPHVDHNLLQSRKGVRIRPAELLTQRRQNFLLVSLF